MTITLDLPEEVERQLARAATRQGLSVDQFVLKAALHQMGEPVALAVALGGAGFGIPSVDPYLEAASARTQAAAAKLVTRGITDGAGNRLRTDLPEDMKEGADRNFGG